MYFYKNLKYLRRQHPGKAKDFFNAIGFAAPRWRHYEAGKSQPSVKYLIQIARFFDISEGDLIHTNLEKRKRFKKYFSNNNIDNQLHFAENFQILRQKMGLGIDDLLETELAFSEKRVVTYEKGRSVPLFKILIAVANFFNVREEVLLHENLNPNKDQKTEKENITKQNLETPSKEVKTYRETASISTNTLQQSEAFDDVKSLISVAVFCGASKGFRREYIQKATELGTYLAEHQIRMVFGGGKIGMMGAIADAMLAKGGRVVGVMPNLLRHEEVEHTGIQKMIISENMSDRKVIISKLVDGYVALPGGFGTLDEIFEALTLGQLGIEKKPIGILNTNGFFDFMLQQLDRMVLEGFLKAENRAMIIVSESITELLDEMNQYEAPIVTKVVNTVGS